MSAIFEKLLDFIVGVVLSLYGLVTTVEPTEKQEAATKKLKKLERFLANLFALTICFVSVTIISLMIYDKLGLVGNTIVNALNDSGVSGIQIPPMVSIFFYIIVLALYLGIVWLLFLGFHLISTYDLTKFWIYLEILNIILDHKISNSISEHLKDQPLFLEMLKKLPQIL